MHTLVRTERNPTIKSESVQSKIFYFELIQSLQSNLNAMWSSEVTPSEISLVHLQIQINEDPPPFKNLIIFAPGYKYPQPVELPPNLILPPLPTPSRF